MFPAALEYRAPTDLDEALSLLRQHGDDAKVLAGGQSLVPLLKLRFATPALLVDIGRLSGLDGIARDDATLRIDALTRHAAVESSPGLPDSCRILTDTAPLVSDRLVRNMGTVGGSVCHADQGIARFATDPVCGMVVDVTASEHAATPDGQAVHFCGTLYTDRFARDPGNFSTAPRA